MTNESNPRRRQQLREAQLHQLTRGYYTAERILVPRHLLDANEGYENTPAAPHETIEPAVEVLPADAPCVATNPKQAGDRDREPRLHLFDPDVYHRTLKGVENLNRNNERRVMIERWLKPFADASVDDMDIGTVPLAVVTHELEQDLQHLRELMPNFTMVIDAIEPMLQLQRSGDRALRMAPLLLLGPPGVGKSYFAEQLARVLRLHYVAVSMETTTAVWVLTGLHQSWSSGTPGLVFNTLARAPHGNPLILIDEIDKATDSKYPPANALYGLLERLTAARFQDEACPDIRLDASAINWVLTANDIERISLPLRSRMQCFEVPEPNAAQRQSIVAQLYRTLLENEAWGHHFSDTLDAPTLRTLSAAQGSVRDLRRTLVQACAYAQRAKRGTLTPGDVIAALRIGTPPIDLATVKPGGHA
jgi:ATP-dependent Lon protease